MKQFIIFLFSLSVVACSSNLDIDNNENTIANTSWTRTVNKQIPDLNSDKIWDYSWNVVVAFYEDGRVTYSSIAISGPNAVNSYGDGLYYYDGSNTIYFEDFSVGDVLYEKAEVAGNSLLLYKLGATRPSETFIKM